MTFLSRLTLDATNGQASLQGGPHCDSVTHVILVDSIADARCDDVCVRAKPDAAPNYGKASCYVIDENGRHLELDQKAVVRSEGEMGQGKGKMGRLPDAGI